MHTPLSTITQSFFGLLRIAFGWIFFWAFIDKLWGLKFATAADKGWLDGGSPTYGFLKMGSKGPFHDLFASIAGTPVVNWLFMLGLLGIGLAFIFGVATRFASICATALVVLMWAAVLPPANNPIIDDHIIYAIVFIIFAFDPHIVSRFSLHKHWSRIPLVQKYSILK